MMQNITIKKSELCAMTLFILIIMETAFENTPLQIYNLMVNRIFLLVEIVIFILFLAMEKYSKKIFLMLMGALLFFVVSYFVLNAAILVKMFMVSVSSVIASIITICLNICFLAVLHWGLPGYFLANIIGPLFQSIYLIIRANVIRDINFKNRYKNETKEMVDYSRPLIANSIAWWINNTSDRYVVVFFCGLAENGIYSVASKIPSIINIFQTIFNQAWTLSAVKDFDPEDKNGFFTNTYKVYNCMMVIACSAIIVFDKFLAGLLYAKDFFIAWKYVPWLTIAILFGAMSGYIGGLFAAVKDSKIFAKSTVYGAVTNIVLNLIFTPVIGALGAAIATTVSYLEVWLFRYWHSKKYIHIKINLARDIFSYVLLIIQSIVLLFDFSNILLYSIELILFLSILLLYLKDIIMLLNKGKNTTLRKGGTN